MKLFLAILSISLAYCSDGDFLDQYIAANHRAELTRPLSANFLYGQLAEIKALVETAQTKRIAAEKWDMADSLALAGNAAAKATVLARHDNKQFETIEDSFTNQLAILEAQRNIIAAGDLSKAWREIFRVKVAADLTIETNG